MKKYVAVFRSRTDVMAFIDDMKKSSYFAKAIPTPKEAKVGCGISAEFSVGGIVVAKRLISNKKYPSFYAVFLVEKNYRGVTTVRI